MGPPAVWSNRQEYLPTVSQCEIIKLQRETDTWGCRQSPCVAKRHIGVIHFYLFEKRH